MGEIRSFENAHKCVDAGSLQNGSLVTIWDCNGTPQQKWGYALSTNEWGYIFDDTGNLDADPANLAYPDAAKGTQAFFMTRDRGSDTFWRLTKVSSLTTKNT